MSKNFGTAHIEEIRNRRGNDNICDVSGNYPLFYNFADLVQLEIKMHNFS